MPASPINSTRSPPALIDQRSVDHDLPRQAILNLRRMLLVLSTSALWHPIASAKSVETDNPLVDPIIVTAQPAETFEAVAETHHTVSKERIGRIRPLSSADIVEQLPAAYVTTNSRGEALVYLRNAAERQVTVFFDGAALNVPWDNRYDLGLLPAGMIGRVTSAAGPPSPQYGVNAVGAVSFTGLSADTAGISGRLEPFFGTQARHGVKGSIAYRAGDASLAAAGSHYRADGDALADRARLPFFQESKTIRTNTDVQAGSAYLRGAYESDEATLSTTVLFADVERGIAPEGDRSSSNRFWRYPEARTAMVIARGETMLGARSDFTGTVWIQDFRQTIDSFVGANYQTLAGRENSSDRTYGGRAILVSDLGPLRLTSSVNYLRSYHHQRDTAFDDGAMPTAIPSKLTYSQDAGSFGFDAEMFASDRITLVGSAGIDWIDYRATGDKPSVDPYLAPVLRLAAAWKVSDTVRLRAAVGQKSRVPTMRELFGQALGRFLINPELKPETIKTGELGLDIVAGSGELQVVAFGSNLRNSIDQQPVDERRQRINLPGSYVVGIEASGQYSIAPQLDLGGNLMFTRSRRQLTEGAPYTRVLERPSLLVHLIAAYRFKSGTSLGAEVEYAGRAYSADVDNETIALPKSLQLNLDGTYPLFVTEGAGTAELYFRGTNLTNTYVEPQAGLPAPGRSVVIGVDFTW